MAQRCVQHRRESGYSVIEIARPAAGSHSREQLDSEIADIVNDVSWDEGQRVAVLQYHGDALQSLDDIPGSNHDAVPPFVESVANLKMPVIAAIAGDAIGTGLELALACDIRIGTEGASFCLPQVGTGLMPADGGTQRLPRYVGLTKALEIILLGQSVSAEDALRIGLVNRLAPAAEVNSTAATLASRMAARAPIAARYAKEAMHKGMDLTLDQGIQMELNLYLLLFSTEDRIEGINAFRDKRPPNFRGR